MNARKLAVWILDTALCVGAVGAMAAQPFGRDSVYAEPGKTSTPITHATNRAGRDSVYVARGVLRSEPQSIKIAALKPGRT